MRCAVLGECRMIVATVKPSFSVHTPRWLFAPKYGLFCVVTTKISDCYLLDWRCPPWSACLRSHLRQTREVRRRWWWWSSPARSSSSSSSPLSSSRLYFFSFLLFHFPRNMSQAAHKPSKTREREKCRQPAVTNPASLWKQIHFCSHDKSDQEEEQRRGDMLPRRWSDRNWWLELGCSARRGRHRRRIHRWPTNHTLNVREASQINDK